MRTAGRQSGDQSSQVAKRLGIRIPWEAKAYSHPIGRRREALGCVRRGTGWMEGGPVSTSVIKSPVSPASQNTRNPEGAGSYHPVVKHPIQQGGVVVVLAVQVLTHNLDVRLLAHLLG